MCVTDLGTKVGFLWGLSVPDLEDLDLRKTRRSRTGSGLGRWHRKSGTVISLKVKLEEDPSVQKNRPPTLCSVPHILELRGRKGKCQCLWQGNEPTTGGGFSKQTSCWHTTRPKPSWAGLHKLLKWILDKPARLILRLLFRFSSKFIIFVHSLNNISWNKQIEEQARMSRDACYLHEFRRVELMRLEFFSGTFWRLLCWTMADL